MNRLFPLALLVACSLAAFAQVEHPELGFKDTPVLPGLSWHVHDPDRPHPAVVTPATTPSGAPSDAMVLFDGTDLAHWRTPRKGDMDDPRWKVADGSMEVVPKTGDLATREKFGDVQLHLEWASPDPPSGASQGRGNSGVLLMGRYEVQVLDSWNNPTYADGQAGALYGQWPPLVNPVRPPGQWNIYEIVFEAPRMDGDRVLKPAFVTVFLNGVLVQNRRELMGPTLHRQLAHYTAQPAEDSLVLQNHSNPVRFRNIWVRRLAPAEEPAGSKAR